MRILHCVESYHPNLGGMQEVVKQLSERLSAMGHEVTVLTRYNPDRKSDVINGVRIESFRIEGNPRKPSTQEEHRYIARLLGAREDVVTFFAAQQWATDLALPHLREIKQKKVSVPTGYSGLYWPQFKQYFIDMKTYIHGYDMNVYLSDNYRDINFARENGVTKMTIIPNGAGEDEFLPPSKVSVRKKLGIPEDHFLVLHVGSFTGWKGHPEAVEIFLRSKLRKATLLMIGNNHEAFQSQLMKRPLLALRLALSKLFSQKRVIYTYVDRAYTVDAYRESDLFLFPSNIECSPIVLFECAAARVPFLSTDVGNAVEISGWTGGGRIIPTKKDPEGFSHAVIADGIRMLNELYEDSDTRARMTERAFTAWKKSFSWEVIARRYESLYEELLR
jgi:L-malate glycosyltransferase